MDYLLYLLIAYTIITGVTDLIYGKVHNVISIIVFLVALVIKISSLSTTVVIASLFAGFICFMCFIPLFYLSIIGGGDAKMMFVLGFIVGYHKVLDTLLLSFLLSAVFAVVILLIDGRGKILFQRIKVFILSLFYPGMKIIVPSINESLKAPVAFALGISAILTYTNTLVGL